MRKMIFIGIIILGTAVYMFRTTFIDKSKSIKKLDIMVFSPNYESLNGILYKYSEENNIKINLEEAQYFNFTSAFKEKSKKNEKIPDIFLVVNDWIGDLVEKNLIEEVKKENLNELSKIAVESIKYKNRYYGYPFKEETLFLFYNPKYIKKVPNKISDLLILSKKIKEKYGIEGMVFPTDEYYYHFPWYSYVGGDVKELINISDKTLNNMEKEMKIIKNNFKYMNSNLATTLFKDDKAAMMINGPWSIDYLKGVNYKIKTIKDEKFKPFVGIKTFVIYKKSKEKVEAEKLLKYLIGKDIQEKWSKDPKFISVNKNVKNSMKNGIIMPNSPKLNRFWMESNKMIYDILKNSLDIKKSIKKNLIKEKIQ
ncbi:sugar ABC transporter substrate-binding protein [Haliovirga abyssi]|uniref:Maltose ABC transporter substrate-binding protein n=1 Tax=Haliovirga abyssi TaxID=2996794 RepID=A0AAU9DBU4_9FUSO|nr:extracellular solute-binding protein [Haliovirga abyssi]BDU49742.1 maltose ABC transporter substrate-binding protein [Haliovirga abyssi]